MFLLANEQEITCIDILLLITTSVFSIHSAKAKSELY